MLFGTACRFGAARENAILMVTAYGFGSIAFLHALLFSGHQLTAALSFASFAGVAAVSRSPNGPVSGATLPSFAAGLAAGAAALTEYTAMFTVLVIAIYLLFRPVSLRCKAAFFLGGIPAAIALASYNTACFGGPFRMSYDFLSNAGLAEGSARGFYGISLPDPTALGALLFSPSRGLLFIMPVFALSAVGLRRMWTAGLRSEVLCIGAIVIGFLWINAGFYGWHGGWTFGPRYLTPMLPFLAFPLVFAPVRSTGFLVLLGLSVVQVLLVAITFNHIPQDIAHPLREIVVPFLRYGVTNLSLGDLLGLKGAWSILPTGALLLPIGFALARGWRRGLERSGSRTAAVLAAVALTAFLVSIPLVRTAPQQSVHCVRAELLDRMSVVGALGEGAAALEKEKELCGEAGR
jgi:hypothetical protein